jgi:site-specific DNA-methyltransferase (adenine-specific)
MLWCLQLADPWSVVIDPYMGSGTTLLAAKALGRRAVGVEVNERYCEIAARRLGQEVLPLEGTA